MGQQSQYRISSRPAQWRRFSSYYRREHYTSEARAPPLHQSEGWGWPSGWSPRCPPACCAPASCPPFASPPSPPWHWFFAAYPLYLQKIILLPIFRRTVYKCCCTCVKPWKTEIFLSYLCQSESAKYTDIMKDLPADLPGVNIALAQLKSRLRLASCG